METTTAAAAPPAIEEPSFILRHQFVIYRLFSLSGLIPVGAYLVIHLLTNATVLNGPMAFQEQVDRIHSLGIVLPVMEWTFIFIPLIFHAAIGWLIISGALPNTNAYPYASNVRYTLQRATGIIAFVFIMFHVAQLHHLVGAPFKDLGGAQFDDAHAASSAAAAIRPLWIEIAYVIGLSACVYHFANGLWTQGITWGLWTTPAAQRRANWVTIVVGVGLELAGLGALGGMNSLNIEKARQLEDAMQKQLQPLEELNREATAKPIPSKSEASPAIP